MPEYTPNSPRPSTSRAGTRPPGTWDAPSPEEMQAMLPQYRFVALLGRGGMGAVYRALQISLDRDVAIKVLPGDLLNDTEANFSERFKNEARLMAKMNHPAIVKIHDFGQTKTGLLYIVMEFIDGTDVSKMIVTQGRLPEAHALAITAHVCDALEYAHTHGVIHRDIKPANVLINMDGVVKVADFGLAKASDPNQAGLTQPGSAMGTPDFVAPEALISGIPLDGRADIYAVGVMLYQMLTGNIPRGMWTMPSIMVQTDPRFDGIIARAMQVDREARHQSALDLRRDLDVILTVPHVKPGDKHSSAAIPKAELAVAKQQQAMVVHRPAQKPAIVRAGQPSRRPPPPQVITYAPEKSSYMLSFVAAVLIGGAALFFFQKMHKPADASHESAVADDKPAPVKVADPSMVLATEADGVRTFGGHRYEFLPGPFAKDEDSSRAAALGGHLLTINSAEEQTWIEQTFAALISLNSKGLCRIGGRIASDGKESWLTGEPWGYASWWSGFPADPVKYPILALKHGNATLLWQNTHWSAMGSTIIEWDDTTTPIPAAELAAPLASALPAPADALAFGGHRYKLIRGFVSWNEARDKAADLGGHLVTLTSREEDDWVRATFVNDLPSDRLVLTGAYKPSGTAQWLWTTGEPWAFENWRTKDDSTSARGATYQKKADGKSGWVAVWSPATPIIIASGPEQGQPRTVGFVVEWDDGRVSSLALDNSTSVPAKPDAVGSAADGAPINLLAGVDVKRDAMSGKWELKAGEPLLNAANDSSGKSDGNPWKFLSLSTEAPEEYDFEVEFTIVSGQPYFAQVLPVPGGVIEWKSQPAVEGPEVHYGFGPKLENRWLNDKSRTKAVVRRPELTAQPQRHHSVVEVRKGSLRAVLDGREMVKWSGDFKSFERPDKNWPDPKFPGIGGMNTVILYHKAELREAGSFTRRLARLEDQFKEAWERDVTKSSAGQAIADLDGKYLAALDRALADATKAGSLDDATALTAEKNRVADKAPLPAADAVNIVGSLRKLRDTYRKAAAPLIKARDAVADPVYARYDEALSALEVELMQKSATADARTVKDLRETLNIQRQPAASTSVIAAAAGSPPNLASPVLTEKMPDKGKPKAKASSGKELPPEMLTAIPPKPFTQEEAIHWALSLNGSAKVIKGKDEVEVIAIGFIPKGKYTLVSLKIGERQPLHVVSLAGLSELTDLRELKLDKNLITDAGLAFLPPLPKLESISLNECGLTDAGLAHLAKQHALTQLLIGNNNITGTGLSQMPAAVALQTLTIGSNKVTADGVSAIARCTALQSLDLACGGPVAFTSLEALAALKNLKSLRLGQCATDAIVQSLFAVPQLEALDLSYAPITDFALDRISAMTSLRDISFYGCKDLTDSGYLKLLPLGKSITRLIPARTRLSDAGFKALSTKLTEITELDLSHTGVSPAGLDSLGNLRRLSSLRLHALHCTDEGLKHLARVLNLKTFGISEQETLTKDRQDAVKRATTRWVY